MWQQSDYRFINDSGVGLRVSKLCFHITAAEFHLFTLFAASSLSNSLQRKQRRQGQLFVLMDKAENEVCGKWRAALVWVHPQLHRLCNNFIHVIRVSHTQHAIINHSPPLWCQCLASHRPTLEPGGVGDAHSGPRLCLINPHFCSWWEMVGYSFEA